MAERVSWWRDKGNERKQDKEAYVNRGNLTILLSFVVVGLAGRICCRRQLTRRSQAVDERLGLWIAWYQSFRMTHFSFRSIESCRWDVCYVYFPRAVCSLNIYLVLEQHWWDNNWACLLVLLLPIPQPLLWLGMRHRDLESDHLISLVGRFHPVSINAT